MAAPSMPRSATPNAWLSTWTAGATLTGYATTRNQLSGGAPKVTLVGAKLDDTYIVYDNATKIVEGVGGGIDTAISYGGGYTLPDNVENLAVKGTQAATLVGNAGANLLMGNDGDDRFATGGGNDVIVLGKGKNYMQITQDAGSTAWISGLKTSGAVTDIIDLYGYGFRGFDELLKASVQVGSDVAIDLGAGQTLMIENKKVADLTPNIIRVENNTGGMHLVFHDEFDSLSLNMTSSAKAGGTWRTMYYGGDRTLSGNAEAQLYVDPNYKGRSSTSLGINPFSIDDGVLSITAQKTSAANLSNLYGYQYTSGVLTSQYSFAQTYGYFEMRAKTTPEQGMWPAFWLLREDGVWPHEIDILEQVGNHTEMVHNGLIRSDKSHASVGTNMGYDTSADFHTYALDWTKDTLTWYFDGQKTFQVATPADMTVPMYIVLNLAVGGGWAGWPDSTTDWSNTSFQIDYVRVYSHDPNANPAPTVKLGNLADMTLAGPTYMASATGANTSRTYTGSDLKLSGVASSTSVSVAYDANNALTVTNKAAWNAIKGAVVNSAYNGSVTIDNFVEAHVKLGAGDSVINITGAKRGSAITDNGNDQINVELFSNEDSANVFKISSGEGTDRINVSGADMTVMSVDAGKGDDRIEVSGLVRGTVNAGAGDDLVRIFNAGKTTVTGGAGKDIFQIAASAQAIITDFVVGQDSLQLDGIAASDVKITDNGSGTVLTMAGDGSVQLQGVHGDFQIAYSGDAADGSPNPAPRVKLGNLADMTKTGPTYTAASTGANTSRTYTGADLNLAGVDRSTSVSVAYDANNALTVTNKAAWNAIKGAVVDSASNGSVSINNFVETHVKLGAGDSVVNITGAKRGSVITDSGNDQINVKLYSNEDSANVFKISSGEGADQINVSGEKITAMSVDAGAGNDRIEISGGVRGTVNGGAGDDLIRIFNTGKTTATGGAGKDTFEIAAKAQAIITDFMVGQDRLQLNGVAAGDIKITENGSGTVLTMAGGGSVQLQGVHGKLTAGTDLFYA